MTEEPKNKVTRWGLDFDQWTMVSNIYGSILAGGFFGFLFYSIYMAIFR